MPYTVNRHGNDTHDPFLPIYISERNHSLDRATMKLHNLREEKSLCYFALYRYRKTFNTLMREYYLLPEVNFSKFETLHRTVLIYFTQI